MTDRRLTSQTFLWLSMTAYGVAFLVGIVVGASEVVGGLLGAGVAWVRRKRHG